MAGVFRLLRIITVVSALVTGGLALWRRRDRIKQLWTSAGGYEGIVGSASRMAGYMGSVKDLMAQFGQFKK